MKYMLDTNICIYLIKQRPSEAIEKFRVISPGDVAVSTVTVAEMMYGVEKSQHKERNRSALELFLAPLEIVDFDYKAAEHYGMVRAYLESRGTPPIGAYDLMIAAHAMSLHIILVTNNQREYSRIPDLMIENWV